MFDRQILLQELNLVAERNLVPWIGTQYGVQHIAGTTAVVRRYGEAIFPVDVLITFENSERVTEHWDGRERWKACEYEGKPPIRSVQVDQQRVLVLDVSYTNNSKTTQPTGIRAARRWSASWMVWLENCLLSWVALL